MSLLEEMTKVILTRPDAAASPSEIAAWYERKAGLLERIAAEDGTGSPAHDLATAARARALQARAA